MIATFLESFNENIMNITTENYDMMKKYITESINVNMNVMNEKIIPFKPLDDSVARLTDLCQNLDELESFYSKIYVSEKLNSIPMTIPVLDVSEISVIKPKYLSQFAAKSANMIENCISGKMSRNDIAKITDEKYVKNLKKQIVVSNLPDYVTDKELVTVDTRTVHTVDSNFISTNILPFIRTMKLFLKSTIKLSAEIKTAMADGVNSINSYITTFNRLKGEGKIENINNANLLMVSLLTTFLNLSKYTIACFIRMCSAHSYNLQEYIKLKESIKGYYPEGEHALHESVLDGIDDFRDEDFVHQLVNGSADPILSANQRIARTYKDFIEENNMLNGLSQINTDIPYDENIYKSIGMMFKTIGTSLKTFYDLLQNPDTPIQDIKEKSGLSVPFPIQFESILNNISDISFYTEYDNAEKKDVYGSIINELEKTQKILSNYGGASRVIFNHIKSIKDSVDSNINNQYENDERNKETLLFLDEVEKNYRDFLLMFSKSLMKRYHALEANLKCSDNTDEIHMAFESDYNDYLEMAKSTNIELQENLNSFKMNVLYESFKVDMDKSRYFVEADNTQQNATNTTTAPTTNQNNQTQNDNQNSTKPTITDNSGESSEGQSSSGGNKVEKSFIEKVIEKVRNFIQSLITKITKAINENKGNLKWLQYNKEGLQNRSYNNVSVNMLPYNKGVDVIGFIDGIITNLKGMDKTRVGSAKKKDDATKLLFGNQFNINSIKMEGEVSIGAKITQYLKIGYEPLKTVPLSNGALKEQIPEMITFCENYYNTYVNTIKTKTDEMLSALDEFCNKMVGEIPQNGNEKDNASMQEKITAISSTVNAVVGAATNAMKDRANDYMTVLNSLSPKTKAKKSNENSEEESQGETEEK